MSKIAEQIRKLKEQEKRLERETRKVEFLTHILDSAKDYEHAAFQDVKADVVSMLDQFVKKSIEAIEAGTVINITVGGATEPQPVAAKVETTPGAPETPKEQPKATPQPYENPQAKLSFALEHRHLSGKAVSVINDMNLDVTGTVVGLDAPFVLVKTKTGPVIKVPVEKINLG